MQHLTRSKHRLNRVIGSFPELAGRPLTLAEKTIYSHVDVEEQLRQQVLSSEQAGGQDRMPLRRGITQLRLRPDRVAMQDASAQMALLQFMQSGRKSTAVPTSIHCDHLITAKAGEGTDLKRSLSTDEEVYQMLESFSRRYGIEFWRPGSGIIHQLVLENYATPGQLMIGTDSHTPNAGGLGMLAIGVGGADAVDAMAGIPWELTFPKVIGVKLTGRLSGWTAPKDVILNLAGQLTVRGGTGAILEYFGSGTETLSCTGKATICNMGAEVGATCSVFPYDSQMRQYLVATDRQELADHCDHNADMLRADPKAHYDRVIEIDLSALEPHVNGPFSPDLATPISQVKQMLESKGISTSRISAALIGSCTNSSYEDLSLAESIIKQASKSGLKMKTEFLVSPGSERVRAAIERDGQAEQFTKAGGQLLANACGPCIGQWDRSSSPAAKGANIIVTSFNRNFRSRNDGNAETMNFLASPQLVTAMAFAGDLAFNPVTDTLTDDQGRPFRFQPPRVNSSTLPSAGLSATTGRPEFQPPERRPEPINDQPLLIDPQSQRLQLLEPFPSWSGGELQDLLMLLKVRGKCTTDHISAAGKWLKFKGHLENISENTLIGARNALNDQVNCAVNYLTGRQDTIPNVAKYYRQRQENWFVVAEDNYGEGSAREHAALQPRYLGCSLIIAKSFARIHETNLKKQGVLPLTFQHPSDYDRLPSQGCRISTVGLSELIACGKGELKLLVKPLTTGEEPFEIPVVHSMSAEQLKWFKHGSALNMIRHHLLQTATAEEVKQLV